MYRQNVPHSISKVILGKCPIGFTCKIGTKRIRYNEDFSTMVQNSFIVFDVLITYQARIEEPILVEDITSPTAKRHSIHLLDRINTCPKNRVTHPEAVTQHLSDSTSFRSLTQDIRMADCTYIVRFQLLQPTNQSRKIVTLIRGVTIESDNHISMVSIR